MMLAVDVRTHSQAVPARSDAAPPERATRKGAADRLTLKADPIRAGTPLRDAIETFRRFPTTRFLAVVDGRGRPLGAIHERMVRDLLFSPFGHALLANPGCRWTLEELIRPCATIEDEVPVDRMITAYGYTPDTEGLILTREGCYQALLPGPALLQLAAERERAEQKRQLAEAKAAIARGHAIEEAFARFQADAIAFGQALAGAAAEIHASARGVTERANQNGGQALMVAAAAIQSSDSIAEVAASSSEFAGQGRRIEARVADAIAAFDQAVAHVEEGAGKARSLTSAADDIGSVVGLIAAIAAKVNMLAINATIEAARAGPAGRSFAVVAGEVKTLAGQAGQAARQIETRIRSIRAAVADNAAANRAVEQIVRGLGDVTSDISHSVGEQAEATRLIAANVEQAALGSARVSTHIGEIGARANAAGEMAVRLGEVAQQLATQAEGLSERVETFLYEVRAA